MILIIDDDRAIRTSLQLLLRRAGHDVVAVPSPASALETIRGVSLSPALILLDMNFSGRVDGQEGLELLQKIKILLPAVPVFLITAWGSIPLAVEGMKLGAADFITKPWDNAALLRRIDTELALRQPSPIPVDDFDRSAIIGHSPALEQVLKTAARIAPTDVSVLILGENGTGKELLAESIHRASRRRSGPFVKVNLGGMSQSLFESEMFGHRKGAFTGAIADRKGRFELADQGTIFLDEIGDLDPSSQVKMLRVLQEQTFEPLGDSHPRRVDVRVISATNAPLQQMIADGTFREDLFYRINLITLTLPPLRERPEDIPLLVKHFAGDQFSRFTPEVLDQLMRYPWPGNIRELKNAVDRLLLIHDGPITHASAQPGTNAALSGPDDDREAVKKALSLHPDSIAAAARSLGISRQALYRRIEKYGLKR
ncbi:MAG: sigma-54 dependent transcriptional regulator [Bacteroidales bacterium]|nr:sigma-54 dependent transcriptional regulator [Bacteroidales bacterium]